MAFSLPKLLPGTPPWGEQNAAALRDFLSTTPGQLLLRSLIHLRPEVTGVDRDARAIKSDERAGFEGCIGQILALADPEQPLTAADHAAQTRT